MRDIYSVTDFSREEIGITGERGLWTLWILHNVREAIRPHFDYADLRDLRDDVNGEGDLIDKKYNELRNYYLETGAQMSVRGNTTDTNYARHNLCMCLDNVIDMLGWDTGRADIIFKKVQKCITYEKKLWDEFKNQGSLFDVKNN